MNILYKFPTRERPHELEDALDSITFHSSCKNHLIWTTLDEGDPTEKEYLNILGSCHKAEGNSKSKVDAINRNMPFNYDWDILIVMSDDMRFCKIDYDEIIRKDMKEHFPDLDGVLHYNDGTQRDNCMTMSIIGRKYYERFGYIYNPEYKSLWCDVEATEVAHILGKYIYLGDENILFRHMHATMTNKKDRLFYANENEKLWQEDKATFLKRRANYYGIPPQDRKNNYKYTKPF